jgi:2,4-dichlorophenol 6-monooxygenase
VGRQVVERANQSRLDYAPLNRCFRDLDAANPVRAGLDLLASPGPEGVARRAALAEALDLKNTEFNALGVESNQRCVSGAVLPEPDAQPEAWPRDAQLHANPSTRPGAKMPHAWLVGPDGRRVSTLDLVGHGRFTLVTGIAGTAWVQAVQALDLPWLQPLVIGAEPALDAYCTWQRLRGMAEAGALLVRPDGVIAWRHADAPASAAHATAALTRALDQVLDRSA